MAYYMSMQTFRFRSASDYEQFKMLLTNVDEHLRAIDGFIHFTWWVHPNDPTWFNEISIWSSKEATEVWHSHGYHKYLKQWAKSGGAIENMITNWECVESRMMRICPLCGHPSAEAFKLEDEVAVRKAACSGCGFKFPSLDSTPDNLALFCD